MRKSRFLILREHLKKAVETWYNYERIKFPEKEGFSDKDDYLTVWFYKNDIPSLEKEHYRIVVNITIERKGEQ